jgi:hypothetical protein
LAARANQQKIPRHQRSVLTQLTRIELIHSPSWRTRIPARQIG